MGLQHVPTIKDRASEEFVRLDTDRDGSITLQELTVGMRSIGVPVSEAAAKELFDRADKDHDGRLSKAEFSAFCEVRMRQLREVYDDLDSDKNGALSSLEIQHAVESLGMKVSSEELGAMVRSLDPEGKGSVGFEVFCDRLLLLPVVNPKAVFEGWNRVAIDDAQSEYTVPRDTGRKGKSLLTSIGEKLYCGGVAGAVSRTATAPIDRIKMVLQATPPGEQALSLAAGFRKMYAEGGLTSMFRGNGVNVLKIAPETAIKFFAFDVFKGMVSRDKHNVGVGERFVAGGMAGGTTQATIYPMEILKTRMAVSPAGTYKSILHCARSIVSTEGASSLYKGLLPSIIGIVPYAGVDLMVNSVVREVASKHYAKRGEEPGVSAVLASGMVSSTAAMLTTYPLNLVRTRLQASGMPGAPVYDSAIDCLKQSIQKDGVRGLYRGLLPNMLKVLPATSISYAVYDVLQKDLR